MKLLALDTSTAACSVCVYDTDTDQFHTEYEVIQRMHGDKLLPMVEQCLQAVGLKLLDLDALAFGAGPGSFTGLRIATGVIQGLALGADLPVVRVSSLRAMAQRAYREHQATAVLAAFDARQDEVYFGAYQLIDGLMQPVIDDCVIAPAKLSLPQLDLPWVGVGIGWQVYEAELKQALGLPDIQHYPEFYPHAEDIAVLGRADFEAGKALPAEQAIPFYLRDKVVN